MNRNPRERILVEKDIHRFEITVEDVQRLKYAIPNAIPNAMNDFLVGVILPFENQLLFHD
jgi:hypothetical protein